MLNRYMLQIKERKKKKRSVCNMFQWWGQITKLLQCLNNMCSNEIDLAVKTLVDCSRKPIIHWAFAPVKVNGIHTVLTSCVEQWKSYWNEILLTKSNQIFFIFLNLNIHYDSWPPRPDSFFHSRMICWFKIKLI